ncbi:MAG: tRNA (adenosine(37)-N6)-dimethylallyltransferase MiaA [Acidimicrobiales bacterium]|nr:tRNA (adenosine(37)-N6)-dimethylallyltransferase MiaA [Acidimicrobiales bacterium]HRW38358.1 tRNA (adenosine(37)-N6)-dimethylallyltransferase MiaA [Aquihabitans sp.]
MAEHRLLPPGAPAPLAIVGTTASGKSSLALALARRRGDVELVSVDSMQVYRGMDLGTAKPTVAEQAEVRHHVIDLVDPTETFDVRRFQVAVADALADIADRDRRAVLVGGTGLYLQAVIDGFEIPGQFPEVAADLAAEPDTVAMHARLAELDPLAAARMEPTNRRRVVRALEVTLGSGRPFSSYGPGVDAYGDTPVRLVGIRLPGEVIAARIEARYAEQMADGFLAEVEALHAGPPLSRTAAQALGYRELLAHLDARVAGRDRPTLDEALDEAVRRTRAFARRQRAWFRRDPRIAWLDAVHDPAERLDDLIALADDHWGG